MEERKQRGKSYLTHDCSLVKRLMERPGFSGDNVTTT